MRHQLFSMWPTVPQGRGPQGGVIALSLLLGIASQNAVHAQISAANTNKTFPAGVVVNVVTDYGADPGDNSFDDTPKIQQAIHDNIAKGCTIYFPNGVYNVNKTLVARGLDSIWKSGLVLQGQSRDGAIIRLRDNLAEFNSTSSPRETRSVIATGSQGAVGNGSGNRSFNNNIFDLTINTGNNTQAIGIEFQGNNQSAINNVVVNGSGRAGISQVRDQNGPNLVKNVAITGFAYGIETRDTSIYENISLNGQSVAGFGITNSPTVTIRKLHSSNSVPALLHNNGGVVSGPLVTLLDSSLSGGSSSQSAIHVDGHLLVRNVQTSGYARAIYHPGKNVDTANVTEYVSNDVLFKFSSLGKTLGLPVEDAPPYWNGDLSKWRLAPNNGVNDSATGDPFDTNSIQNALDYAADHGQKVVCLTGGNTASGGAAQGGRYDISRTIVIPAEVEQILGMGAELQNCTGYFEGQDNGQPRPVFLIEPRSTPLYIENFHTGGFPSPAVGIENRGGAGSALVLKNVMFRTTGVTYRNTVAGGKVFLEDVSNEYHQQGVFEFNGQTVFARQFNPETYDHSSGYVAGGTPIAQVNNHGGKLWLLGLKTEGVGPITRTTNSGETELFGGFHMWSGGESAPFAQLSAQMRVHIIENSKASLSYIEDSWYQGEQYTKQISETRNGENRELATSEIPLRNGPNGGSYARIVALYSASPASTTPPSLPAGWWLDSLVPSSGNSECSIASPCKVPMQNRYLTLRFARGWVGPTVTNYQLTGDIVDGDPNSRKGTLNKGHTAGSPIAWGFLTPGNVGDIKVVTVVTDDPSNLTPMKYYFRLQ